MNNRLYIGNLSPAVSEETLRGLFSQKGTVAEVKLALDPVTRQSRGTAFITMATGEEAAAAQRAFHSYGLGGRYILVTEARPVEQPTTGLIGQGFDSGVSRFTPPPQQRSRGTFKRRSWRQEGRERGQFKR